MAATVTALRIHRVALWAKHGVMAPDLSVSELLTASSTRAGALST
jgi:hypothetical protein